MLLLASILTPTPKLLLPLLQEDPRIHDGTLEFVCNGQTIQDLEHEQTRLWLAITLFLDFGRHGKSFVDQKQKILDVGPRHLPIANSFCKGHRRGISEQAYLLFSFRVVGPFRYLDQRPVNY